MFSLLLLCFGLHGVQMAEVQRGRPVPFTVEEMYTMLALHNMKRSEAKAEVSGQMIYQSNMECLTNVSVELAIYAQQLADSCADIHAWNDTYGVAVYKKNGVGRPGPYDYINAAERMIETMTGATYSDRFIGTKDTTSDVAEQCANRMQELCAFIPTKQMQTPFPS
uniref:SCP domain-containing protein n=1 Tax=Trichuris muris TaxID=70415 RepID=A0A5S6QY82_TRIMR